MAQVILAVEVCATNPICMSAASAVMLETGRKLSESVGYLRKLSGNTLPGFDAHQSEPSILTTPEHKPEVQLETLPAFEGYDNNLITLPEVQNSQDEGFSALPDSDMNTGNTLFNRPTPKESEDHVGEQLAGFGKAQQSFKAGEEVKYGTKGSVRPDFCIGNTCAIEVKNYDLTKNQSALARTLGKQVIARSKNLSEGMTQEVYIDDRGQSITKAQKDAIKDKIVKKTDGIIAREDIKFLKDD